MQLNVARRVNESYLRYFTHWTASKSTSTGTKITLCRDNKVLTFLNECVITSNRVAHWIVNIQEYDVEIRNVKGVRNHPADILSHNPTGLTDNIRSLTRSDQVLVQCSVICRQDHSHGADGSCSLARHRSEASRN